MFSKVLVTTDGSDAVELPLGVPYIEVSRIVAEQGCAAIAPGSHGEGMVEEALIGSTASSVIHHVTLPGDLRGDRDPLWLTEGGTARACPKQRIQLHRDALGGTGRAG